MISDLERQPSEKQSDILTPEGWMKSVLVGAGLYNVIWGAAVVLFPVTLLNWLSLDPMLNYPEFWQAIGMIVGVYGIGYLIAASDPYRHWPIILVGLLGKIFGPIGFASAMINGRLPWSVGWTILTNDLIWGIPFTVILWRAARANQAEYSMIRIRPKRDQFDPMTHVTSQFGQTLLELSRRRNVLVVFLRHSGCTFCRQTLADVGRLRGEIEAAGTTIALVHMGQQEPDDLLEKNNLSDVHCFRDPYCKLYESFGLRIGDFTQLFGAKVLWAGMQAFAAGHRIGRLNGNGFRMPGVFLLRDGQVLKSYRHASVADRPEYLLLASGVEQDTPGHPNSSTASASR
ncbi:SelL-related redox protein [Rubinisphaera margarita]|uniref:SelL-related redox protein n=1 Tax=Rubinisphaera margarita TaxID=2909586 RepID=UPI001EE7FEC9|nr:SelL-related redox protein [Rubinisphaera margarita]MCG6154422.1 hypothetical protein [Rubinisphaera margarita]